MSRASTRNHHISQTEYLQRHIADLKKKGGKPFSMILQPDDVEMIRAVMHDVNTANQSEAIREALRYYVEKKQLKS